MVVPGYTGTVRVTLVYGYTLTWGWLGGYIGAGTVRVTLVYWNTLTWRLAGWIGSSPRISCGTVTVTSGYKDTLSCGLLGG